MRLRLRFLVLLPLLAFLPTRGADTKAPIAEWRVLRGYDYRTGESTPALKKIAGTVIRIPGFMVALDDEAEVVDEFLLVPKLPADHDSPPPPNQIVLVKLTDNKVRVGDDALWIHGKLEIEPAKTSYAEISFKITATKVEPYHD